MAETHVISALSTKRGELLGSIGHYKQLIISLDKDLVNIDATIRIFEPDFKFGSTKAVNKHRRSTYFEVGEDKTLILDTLRVQTEPMRTDDLTNEIMTRKNLIFEEEEYKKFKKSVNNALIPLEKSKLIERTSKEGLMILWKIKDLSS